MNRRKKNILSGLGSLEEGCNKSEYKPILQALKCEALESQLFKDSELDVLGRECESRVLPCNWVNTCPATSVLITAPACFHWSSQS